MNLILKEPAPGDIGWLISVHGLIYSKEFNFDSIFEIDIARKVITFFERRQKFNVLLIAHVNGSRAGSIAVSAKSYNCAFMNFLLVKNEFRRQGVAKKLIETIIEHAKFYKFSKIQLETYSCLINARELYKKLGFKVYEKKEGVLKYSQVFDQEFWEKGI